MTAPAKSDVTPNPPAAQNPPPGSAGDRAADSARHVSPWTLRERIGRAVWGLVQASLFRCSPRPLYAWRAMLLRLFGAKLAANVRVHPTVRIEVPWNLTVGEHTAIGDRAILYCLGPVTLGSYVTISQMAHLCAGSHEVETRQMRLLRPPIAIGNDAWIAADAFVGPGVTIGDGVVLGARASAFGDLPEWTICVGSPAKPIKPRPRLPAANQ